MTKFFQTLKFHGEGETEVQRIIDLPLDHPVVMYFEADRSVLEIEVLIEDGTRIVYAPVKL